MYKLAGSASYRIKKSC